MSQADIASRAANVFETGPLDIGEGRQVTVNRTGWAKLFEDFPHAPVDKELTQHMAGKTLVVWGAGHVGKGAAAVADEMDMNIVFLDMNDKTLEARREEFGPNHRYLKLEDISDDEVDELLAHKDTMGCVDGCLVKGAKAPLIMPRARLRKINDMRAGAELVPLKIADASIDQGGGIEGIHATNHSKMIMSIEGSDVYGVANVPGSRYTAAYASEKLQEATVDDAKLIILARARGLDAALQRDSRLATALNTLAGEVTDEEVADTFGKSSKKVEALLGNPNIKQKDGKIIFVVTSEIKDYENRCAILPDGVKELYEFAAHEGIDLEIRVEAGAGTGIKIADKAFIDEGAVVIQDREELMAGADIVKTVKEPMGDQLKYIPDGVFYHTYFHYAGMDDANILDWACKKNIASFAYETRIDAEGNIPGLIPMSDVDGRANALALAAMNDPQIVAEYVPED